MANDLPIDARTPGHNAASWEEIQVAYKYVDSVVEHAHGHYEWFGWSIREAFLMGMKCQRTTDTCRKEKKP